jgi:SH3 domain-containing YSC84-like protein 1
MTNIKFTALLLSTCIAIPLAGCSRSSNQIGTAEMGTSSQQAIVERSARALEQVRKNPRYAGMDSYLQRARGVMIFPRLVKASLLLGGEGGNGVLVARQPDGSWSAPAFISLGSPSIGLQLGYQQATVVLLIMDQPTLERALSSSVVLGAKAGTTLGSIDEMDHTSANVVSANIYQVVEAEGAFAGLSFDGYVIGTRARHNRDYYGRPVSPREILLDGSAQQPATAVLSRALAPQASAPKLAVVATGQDDPKTAR